MVGIAKTVARLGEVAAVAGLIATLTPGLDEHKRPMPVHISGSRGTDMSFLEGIQQIGYSAKLAQNTSSNPSLAGYSNVSVTATNSGFMPT